MIPGELLEVTPKSFRLRSVCPHSKPSRVSEARCAEMAVQLTLFVAAGVAGDGRAGEAEPEQQACGRLVTAPGDFEK